MEEFQLIHDDSNKIIQKILFERPISRLNARKIGLLAGRHAPLKKIHDIHGIVLALNHNITIVAESELKAAGVPAELYLAAGTKPALPFTNTDEALTVLQDCSYVVVGMDIEISSRLQLFL